MYGIVSVFAGSGADFADDEDLRAHHPAAAAAPGGGRAAGRAGVWARGAGHFAAQRLFELAVGDRGHCHHVQRGDDHGHPGAEKRGEVRVFGGPHRGAGAFGHGHGAGVPVRAGGERPRGAAAARIHRHHSDGHLGVHHRGGAEGAGEAEHQGGQHHFGGGPHRRRAGAHCADGGDQPGRGEREHPHRAAEDSAVLRVCGGGGLCGHQGLYLV